MELDFNINFVSSQNFLERFVQVTKTEKVASDLSQYMIEIALLDYSSIHIKPSYLALSSLYLAKKIMKCKEPWSKTLAQQTQYTEKQVSSLSYVILNLLKSYQRPNTQLVGLKKKFSADEFSNVSTYFQFDTASSKDRSEQNTRRDTTDKKQTISADKSHNKS